MEQLQINDDCLFLISKNLHKLRINDINKELKNSFSFESLNLSADHRNNCDNCIYHSFPCMNCAEYYFKFQFGWGYCNGVKQTYDTTLLSNIMSKWRSIT